MPDYNFNDYDNFSKIRDKYNDCKEMIDQSHFFFELRDDDELKTDFGSLSKENFLDKHPSYSQNDYDSTVEVDAFYKILNKHGYDKFYLPEEELEKIRQGKPFDYSTADSALSYESSLDYVYDKSQCKRPEKIDADYIYEREELTDKLIPKRKRFY